MWFSGRFRQKRIRRAPVEPLPPFLSVTVFMAFQQASPQQNDAKCLACGLSLASMWKRQNNDKVPHVQGLQNGLWIGAPDVDADKCLTFPNDHCPDLRPTDPSTTFDSFDSDNIVDSDGSNQEVDQWFYIRGPHRLERLGSGTAVTCKHLRPEATAK